MSKPKTLFDRKILLIAAFISAIASAAYACPDFMPRSSYPLCRQISLIGEPGILVAAVLTIALLRSHGGGPLGMLLVIATPVNFFLYLAIGLAIRKLAGLFKKRAAD